MPIAHVSWSDIRTNSELHKLRRKRVCLSCRCLPCSSSWQALPDGILNNLVTMINFMKEGEFVRANDIYLLTAIGNAPWPIGLTMVGIHERSGMMCEVWVVWAPMSTNYTMDPLIGTLVPEQGLNAVVTPTSRIGYFYTWLWTR